MIKAFYVEFETTQLDSQCRLELEHAIGEITSSRPVIERIEPMLKVELESHIIS